jgi:chemotaxis protein methyltransferase CheR
MSLSRESFAYVRALVRERSGQVLGDDKSYLAETRLMHLARRHGCGSVGELVERLRARPDSHLQQEVVEAMLITESSFFRDGGPFEVLRRVVLPELVRARAAERRLRFWSAGCAAGQEPYSLALVLCEDFPGLRDWDVRLLASDLSEATLARARRGRYSPAEVARGLPAALLAKYFDRHGEEWEVRADVRRLVEFRAVNLIGLWPALPMMDLVLLRNVLVYLDPGVRKRVLARVRALLRPDGFLLLGGGEGPVPGDGFEPVTVEGVRLFRPALQP